MRSLKILSAVDQVAEHLRGEMREGRLKESMPGVSTLADDLGISQKTIAAALRRVEDDGLISHEGMGKKRRILLPKSGRAGRISRISILMAEPGDVGIGYLVEIVHELTRAGFSVGYASKNLLDLGMNPSRVASFVKRNPADAWVIFSASREVLEWFSSQDFPSFSIFGRFQGLPMAGFGLDRQPVLRNIINNLTRLGHTRIILICRKRRRLPTPGTFERNFLHELENHGIKTSAFNLPDWKETPEGLGHCLDSLFKLTPPTAIIFDEVPFLVSGLRFFTARNLHVPEDVSVFTNDEDASLAWCHPPISHFTWDQRALVRRALRWALNVDRGVRDVKHVLRPTRFVPGAIIAPAK
jgi:DNA-binding LacI/PurR family transcriptional regulator